VSCGRRDGTDAALEVLARVAADAGGRQAVQDVAAGWVSDAESTCPRGDVDAVHEAVRRLPRRAENAPEWLTSPLTAVASGIAGADDAAVLVAAAALALGHRARLRCASTTPGQPPHHVWTLVGIRCCDCQGTGVERIPPPPEAPGWKAACDCAAGTRWVPSDPLHQERAGDELPPEHRHDVRELEVT
jgi:hypothetical protein